MSYTYDPGTTSPVYAGLAEVGGIRINDGTFRTSSLPLIEGSPPVRLPVTALPSDNGGWAGGQFYEDWPFTLGGWIDLHKDPDSVPSAIDQLRGALQVQGLQTLVFNARGWASRRQIGVQIDGPFTFTARNNNRRLGQIDFTVPLLAPDPIAVNADAATTVSFARGASHSISNAGNTGAYLTWVITGPVNDPVLTLGSKVIDLTSASLASGDVWTVTSNPVTGLTVVGSSGGNHYSTVTDWTLFTLPPGSSTLTFTGSSGSGTSTVTIRDSWV